MRRSRSGFTMVEVLVAMMVLAVGLLIILAATGNTVRLLGEADRTVAAAYYANERMERMEALGCDGVTAGSGVRQGIYSLSWTVSGTAGSDTRQIRLTAQYPLGRGRVRADTFEKAVSCIR